MKELLLALFVFFFCLQLGFGGILFPFHGWLTCGFGFAFSVWLIGDKLWRLLRNPESSREAKTQLYP